jgi:hypothetical protein
MLHVRSIERFFEPLQYDAPRRRRIRAARGAGPVRAAGLPDTTRAARPRPRVGFLVTTAGHEPGLHQTAIVIPRQPDAGHVADLPPLREGSGAWRCRSRG